MSKRAPGPPPEIDGYTYLDVLGTGGYADVFLYEQQLPLRKVAVKVLLAEGLGPAAQSRFTAEANTMASLSNHPFIVSIFQAGVAPTGQPYLVMEYYPKPNFAVRAKSEQFPVADVLRTGVQVAGAVETAHRAGILHRDIKPANILTSAYGRPGLTDFGISSSLADAAGDEAEGMSIPWAPPEVIGGSGNVDARADVYSLAATIYTLLARRSPFEVPGGSNRHIDLLARIENDEVPEIGRPDVPPQLERLLRQAMAKVPSMRPSSVAELARSLQAIELEQGLDMTPLEVSDDGGSGTASSHPVDLEAGATRLKAPTTIVSQDAAASGVAPVAPVGPATTGTFADPGAAGSGYAAPAPSTTGSFAAPLNPKVTASFSPPTAGAVGAAPPAGGDTGGELISVPGHITARFEAGGVPVDADRTSARPPEPSIAAVPVESGHRQSVPSAVPRTAPVGPSTTGDFGQSVSSMLDDDTGRRPVAASAPSAPVDQASGPPMSASGNGRTLVAVAAVVVVVLLGIVGVVLLGGDEPGPEEGVADALQPVANVDIDLTGEDQYTVSWDHASSQTGDTYIVTPRWGNQPGAPVTDRQGAKAVLVTGGEPGAQLCVTVRAQRGDELSSEVEQCL